MAIGKSCFLQKDISPYSDCSGSGWNVVNFLNNFGFESKPRVLITHQCFDCGWTVLDDEPFSYSTQSSPSAIRLRVGKIMGGERAETTKLNWPKAGSIGYDVLHNHNNHLPGQLFRVWLGIDLLSEMVSYCCYMFACFFLSSVLHLLNLSYLWSWVLLLLLLLFSSPVLKNLWVEVREQPC